MVVVRTGNRHFAGSPLFRFRFPASAISAAVDVGVAPEVGMIVAGTSASAALQRITAVVSASTVPALEVVVSRAVAAETAVVAGIAAVVENFAAVAGEAIVLLIDVFYVPALVLELVATVAVGNVGLIVAVAAAGNAVVVLLSVVAAVETEAVVLQFAEAVAGIVDVPLLVEFAVAGGAVVAVLPELTVAVAVEAPPS